LSAIKFGTDGWRGIIADVYTFENLRIVAQATADRLRELDPDNKVVIVGYDRRFMSEEFALLAARQIASNGYNVQLAADACPSPATSLLTRDEKAAIGVMITASHNPPKWNGYKLKGNYGGSATNDMTLPIEQKAQAMTAPAPLSPDADSRIVRRDFKTPYMDTITAKVDVNAVRKVKGRVAVDVMHGSGAGYLTPWLKGIGLDCHEIRGSINPSFGGVNPEPIPQNLGATKAAVHELGASLAIISDGDADRIAAMDEDGRFVSPHEVFALLLMHLVEDKGLGGSVAQTVSSTTMVTELVRRYGLGLHKTPVGFKYVADLFLSDPTLLIGGEESGGIGVRDHIPERDSQYNALLLLEMLGQRGITLKQAVQQLWDVVGYRAYDRRDLHLSEDVISRVRETVKTVAPTSLAGMSVDNIDRLDGTRFNFGDGSWLLVRPSGTEPVVRVYAESTDETKVQALLDEGVALCR
jgi:phosphomannomutase